LSTFGRISGCSNAPFSADQQGIAAFAGHGLTTHQETYMARRALVWNGALLVVSLLANGAQAGGFGFSFGGGGGGGGFSFGGGHGGFSFGGGHGHNGIGFGGGHRQNFAQAWNPSRLRGSRGSESRFDWKSAVAGGIKSLVDSATHHPGPNHHHWSQPDRHHVVHPQPVPPPVPVKPVVVASVKANVQPPEKIVTVRRNAKFNLGELMPQPCYGLMGEVARMRAQGTIAEMEPTFAALASPDVLNTWTVIKGRIVQGRAVTAGDIQRLQTALEAIAELPAGIDRDQLNIRMGRLVTFSNIIVLLSTPWPAGGWAPGIPTGAVSVIYCPCLPKDKHYWLPSGDLACGTGGTGELALNSGDATKLLDMPLGVGAPMPESDADVAKRVTSGVLLMNPVENRATVQYVLANKNYNLTPSFKQALPAGQPWVVSFDRGARFGTARYTLTKGTYMFGSSKRGWDLYNQKFQVTIDNSASAEPFYYAIDNQEAEVPAGGQVSHSSEYPLIVRFDRGDGMEPSQKKIEKPSVSLVVALNAADGLWDLYPSINFPGQKLSRAPSQPERPLVLAASPSPAPASLTDLQAAPQCCE
jgi:hypothetical protein